MDSGREDFANNIEGLKAALVAERGERIIEAARAAHTEAELAVARAKASDDQALIANQQLQIEKLTRQLYGPRSERTSRLLDHIELQFEELESSATAGEVAAEMAVAKATTVVALILKRFEAHVFAADRLHGDDTTVPVLAKGKTDIGRCWVYVRDDRPFGGTAPPAAMFYYSRDRAGEHPQAHLANYAGIFQADAYGGYKKLYESDRKPGPNREAARWGHARRPFFIMADVAENARRKAQGKKPAVISPLALEAVRRIDALFEIERGINGQSPEQRRAVRQELSAPLVANLGTSMREQRAKLSRRNDIAKAMDYMLKRWSAFTRFLDDGRICLSNNAAERGVRGIALGRKSWLFCGSDRGGERAAVMYSLIVTAKMNDIDPQAWLADVLARIAEHPVQKLDELLPWNWCQLNVRDRQAAYQGSSCERARRGLHPMLTPG